MQRARCACVIVCVLGLRAHSILVQADSYKGLMTRAQKQISELEMELKVLVQPISL